MSVKHVKRFLEAVAEEDWDRVNEILCSGGNCATSGCPYRAATGRCGSISIAPTICNNSSYLAEALQILSRRGTQERIRLRRPDPQFVWTATEVDTELAS